MLIAYVEIQGRKMSNLILSGPGFSDQTQPGRGGRGMPPT